MTTALLQPSPDDSVSSSVTYVELVGPRWILIVLAVLLCAVLFAWFRSRARKKGSLETGEKG